MLHNQLNSDFKNFLIFLTSAVRLHQKIGIYYDLSYFENVKLKSELNKELRIFFEDFYNVSFFSDYIGGFISNYEGNIQRKLKLFSFVIFLNFDYLNSSHRSFFSELKYANVECILISPKYLDIMALCPHLYINLDLNKLYILDIFKFYFSYCLTVFYKNSYEHALIGGHFPEDAKYYIYNSLYLFCLLQDKKALYFHLRKILNKNAKKLRFRTFLKVLLRPTYYKKRFFKSITKMKLYRFEKIYKLFIFKNLMNKKLLKLFFRIRKNANFHKKVTKNNYLKYFNKKRKELNLK